MDNGIILNGAGPMMSGNWYNPKTGDSFTVQDTFFENNQYLVKTTDGRLLGYNQIQNYVQSDKPIKMEKPKIEEELPDEIKKLIGENENNENEILPEDMNLLKGVSNNNLGNINNQFKQEDLNINQNNTIINKALNKCSKPEFKISIDWKNYPSKEIELLKDIMDISVQEIVNWYISKINTDKIADEIEKSITKYFSNKEVKEEPKPKEAKTKPATNTENKTQKTSKPATKK